MMFGKRFQLCSPSHPLLAFTPASPFIPAFPRAVFCEHLHALGTPRAGDTHASVRSDTSGFGLCGGLGAGTGALLLPLSLYCTVTLS